MNKQQFEELLENGTIRAYNELLEAARTFINDEYIPKCAGWKRGYVDEIEIDDDGIIIAECSGTYCGCCYDDYETFYIPAWYIWDEENKWIELEEEKKRALQLERERKKEEERKAEEIRLQNQRRAQYLRLKEEFEDVG